MFGLIELVVTGLICSLSIAVVAIVIQTLQIRKRKGSRERESLLSSAVATRRLRGKIRIQKAAKVPVPAKHLRSQSIGLTESPHKPSYKYPQQHYRRKSSPNISKIKNSNSSTLVNISPNLKCDKLFSLHQVQPTTSPAGINPCSKNVGDKVAKTGGGKNVNAKTKHLYLPEPKEGLHVSEKFTSPFKTSEKEMETIIGLENLNNNHHAYAYEKGIYIVSEK